MMPWGRPKVPSAREVAELVHGEIVSIIGGETSGQPGKPAYFHHEDGFRWSIANERVPCPREPSKRDLRSPS